MTGKDRPAQLYARAVELANAGRYVEAEAAFFAAARDTPEAQRGVARIEAGDWQGARPEFEALLAKGNPDSTTHMFMSLLLLKLGNPDDALVHLKAAYAQDLNEAQ